MAAKAWSAAVPAVEELLFQTDAVALSLLVNRRAKTMRVVDFRAGPSNEKRDFVVSLARREGVEKVFTLVERDEVSTWTKMGFVREGNIPGFYKRSDAFLLGLRVPAVGSSRDRDLSRDMGREGRDGRDSSPPTSEMRLSLNAPRVAIPAAAATDDDEAQAAFVPEADAAHALMERTLVQAKKAAKALLEKPVPAAKVATLKEADARKAIAVASRTGRALTVFEPFGRNAQRDYYVATTKSGLDVVASTESQSCFGNMFLELLAGPRNDVERAATFTALRALTERLVEAGAASCFSLTPSDDLHLATAYVANGFRRTGLLKSHLVIGGERADAIIWSRKLAGGVEE